MLTETALDGLRSHVRRSIVAARYRVGSTWRDAVINAVELLSSGTIRARLAIIPDGAVTINRVELLAPNGQTWAYQDVRITISAQQTGALYWFDFNIREEDD